MTCCRLAAGRFLHERGSMAIEVVILIPVLFAFTMLVVAFGRFVDTRGEVEALARDAVRAASLERDLGSAQAAAEAVASRELPETITCQPVLIEGSFSPGGIINARLDCAVSFAGLGLIGLPGSREIDVESFAPIDTLRRSG
ncbi:MAG: TadE/TadG family type IV pilus assembly protein [Jiangellaceae bacterium]